MTPDAYQMLMQGSPMTPDSYQMFMRDLIRATLRYLDGALASLPGDRRDALLTTPLSGGATLGGLRDILSGGTEVAGDLISEFLGAVVATHVLESVATELKEKNK